MPLWVFSLSTSWGTVYRDSFCEGQYEALEQPEELPIAPVMTRIRQLPKPSGKLSFAKFDFDGEEPA